MNKAATGPGRPRGFRVDSMALRSILMERGLTHQDLAHRLRVSRSVASNLVAGRFGVSLEKAVEVATVLEVQVEDILGQPG